MRCINKSNHQIALPIQSILTVESSVIGGKKGRISRYEDIDRRVQDPQIRFVIILHGLMLIGFSIHSLTSGGHWKLGWTASYLLPVYNRHGMHSFPNNSLCVT